MKKLLIVSDYGGRRGGVERVAIALRNELQSRNVDARLLTSRVDPWDPQDAPEYSCGGSDGALRATVEMANFSAQATLRRVLREFKPDVVHVQMFMTQLSPLVLRELWNTPTVYTANTYRMICPTGKRWTASGGICHRSVGPACWKSGCFNPFSWQFRRLQYQLLRGAIDAIDIKVAVSQSVAELFREQKIDCDAVIHWGVEDLGIRSNPGKSPELMFVGRLEQEKGVDWLLHAFAESNLHQAGCRLTIVGDGPLRDTLATLANTLGLNDQCRFVGYLPHRESEELLASAWVQIVPSLWAEPFGLVTAEAMMRGTPVVCSDLGGANDMVCHEQSGYLVPPGDTSALSRCLQRIVSRRGEALRIAEQARRFAKQQLLFSHSIDRYQELYAELVSRYRRSTLQ